MVAWVATKRHNLDAGNWASTQVTAALKYVYACIDLGLQLWLEISCSSRYCSAWLLLFLPALLVLLARVSFTQHVID